MIVSVSLVKDEDLWIEKVLKSARAFADHVMVIDNGSTDETLAIVQTLADEVIEEPDLRRTHAHVERFIGNSWVMGIDGDEVYDFAGLLDMRSLIVNTAEYNQSFQVIGQYLHVTEFGDGWARGYAGPPSHTPAKLYNFNLVTRWPNDGKNSLFLAKTKILHCGVVERDERLKELPWKLCPLKCFHTRFLPRSSKEDPKIAGARLTGQDRLGRGNRKDRGGSDEKNLRLVYRQGPVVEVPCNVL